MHATSATGYHYTPTTDEQPAMLCIKRLAMYLRDTRASHALSAEPGGGTTEHSARSVAPAERDPRHCAPRPPAPGGAAAPPGPVAARRRHAA